MFLVREYKFKKLKSYHIEGKWPHSQLTRKEHTHSS